MFRSILCPVDFSDYSAAAVRAAAALGAMQKGRVTVLHLVEPLLARAAAAGYDTDYVLDRTREDLLEFLDRVLPRDWPEAARPAIEARIGSPDAILVAATELQADLIAMGTQGLGGLARLVFGSTTERVLRHATVPVLAVPPGARSEDGPAFQPDLVLIAIDFSEGSFDVAREAVRIADDLQARVLLAHVIAPVHGSRRWTAELSRLDRERTAEAEDRLRRLAELIEPPDGRETVVSLGRPSDVISALAAERQAGLIAIGLGLTGGVAARRPGSTAYRVISESTVPVLALPDLVRVP
jgi:nucleotide-binding universal stress UspA family protein